MSKKWTQEDVAWLVENYEELGLVECARVLDRTESSILHKASRLQLKRRGEGRKPRERMYDGYVYESLVNERVATHRRVMEEHLGRKLERHELVHHIDGDKTNNSIENLELHSRSSHMKLHDKVRDRDAKGRFHRVKR